MGVPLLWVARFSFSTYLYYSLYSVGQFTELDENF